MSQIRIKQESLDLYDLSLDPDEGDHLEMDESLQTAVLISLLTERRASDASEVPGKSLGGWWGDSYPDTPGYMLGSRLWNLRGAGHSQSTMDRAESYVREALQWMVDTGAVESQDSIHVELEWDGRMHRLNGVVTCRAPGTAVDLWSVAWAASLA